jgi:hypothetical protein
LFVAGAVADQPAYEWVFSRQAGYFHWLCDQVAKGAAKDVMNTVLSGDDLKVVVEIEEYRRTEQDHEVREASLRNG